jgi:hypothetical protein
VLDAGRIPVFAPVVVACDDGGSDTGIFETAQLAADQFKGCRGGLRGVEQISGDEHQVDLAFDRQVHRPRERGAQGTPLRRPLLAQHLERAAQVYVCEMEEPDHSSTSGSPVAVYGQIDAKAQ